MSQKRQELLRRAGALIEGGSRLQVVIPQDTGMLTVDPELVDGTLRLLDDASDLMREVTALFEGSGAFEQGAVLNPQEVADLAFICRTELHELRSGLEQAVAKNNAWKIVAEGDRSVARSIRALIPIEAALRDYEGLEPLQRRWFDLDDALEIRRRYVRFWLEAQRFETPSGQDLMRGFETFTRVIADLRQDPIYPYLRIDDRLEIRALQKRILAFLDEPGNEAEVTGRRLWQDMSGFFGLLMQINRREELREHDRLLVGRLCRELYDFGSVPERMPAETHEQLVALASQEPELDRLLLEPGPSRTAAYREPLRRLRDKLMQP